MDVMSKWGTAPVAGQALRPRAKALGKLIRAAGEPKLFDHAAREAILTVVRLRFRCGKTQLPCRFLSYHADRIASSSIVVCNLVVNAIYAFSMVLYLL